MLKTDFKDSRSWYRSFNENFRCPNRDSQLELWFQTKWHLTNMKNPI